MAASTVLATSTKTALRSCQSEAAWRRGELHFTNLKTPSALSGRRGELRDSGGIAGANRERRGLGCFYPHSPPARSIGESALGAGGSFALRRGSPFLGLFRNGFIADGGGPQAGLDAPSESRRQARSSGLNPDRRAAASAGARFLFSGTGPVAGSAQGSCLTPHDAKHFGRGLSARRDS